MLRTVFSASLAISAAAFSWVALRLHAHLDVLESIRLELAELDFDPLDPPSLLNRFDPCRLFEALPLATAFANETLRLHPPAWFQGRELITSAKLGGLELAAGTKVGFSPYLLHRDSRWWETPNQFDIHRWTAGFIPQRYAYLPFGVGRRYCLGSNLALLELVMFVIELAGRYQLQMPAIDEVELSLKPLLRPSTATGSWTRR